MGYPPKNRHPAAIAASAQASFPWSSLTTGDFGWTLTLSHLGWLTIRARRHRERADGDPAAQFAEGLGAAT
jgi:hypothetical protein